ncbi:MAG: glutathione S-transferase [Acidovorax sp.]|uniref:glutathione S-transferase n=1 Tax=Acidovorax sp. TaxID=1872122 RepID=UPI0025C466D3|nr:glutathione S-transferase [Acidovorax sp.]MCE1192723.1 glutathione S-transferase [Acidovorax sp.]
MPPLPILYSFRRCPYALRARLALAVSGQVCELREVDLKHKPQALLQASPKGTVPVLVLPGGQVLDQSLDIMLWALRQHDPEGWLAPTHGTLHDMLALIAECDGPFKRALDRCKYPTRYPGVDGEAERARAVAWLRALETRLAASATPTGHLFGQHPALADSAIAPFVRQFSGIDKAWWDAQPWPQLQGWLARWQEGALFAGVMGDKLAAWVEGTEGVQFPCGERAAGAAPARG